MHCYESLLKKINEEGFVFVEYDSSLVFNLKTNEDKAEALKKIIKNKLSILGENIYVDWEYLNQNEEIKLHYHIVPGSFQAVTWFPEEDFSGREFIYGTKDNLKKIKPKIGLICFFKPNDPGFVHGVSKLESNSKVCSFGFTSSTIDISKTNNDIYV